MRNIALVPERNVLESGLRVRAHHAGKSTDLLASNWIPLVRHRRRAFLFFAEIFFYFADFGTLKMANFRGDFVERAGYHGKSSEISRMAIALNNLRRNCGSFQSQARADFFFQLRAKVGKRADCPGELSYAHVLRRALKASDIALCFGIPVGQLDSKSNRLGVDTVGAADHGRVFEFPGTAFQDLGELLKTRADDFRSLTNEQSLSGINHVVGGQSVMEPARFRAHDLSDSRRKSDNIMAHFGFDLIDPLQPEIRSLADSFGSLFRYHASFGQSVRGGDLNRQPGAKAVLIAPNAAYLRAGITWNQVRSLGCSEIAGLRILNG